MWLDVAGHRLLADHELVGDLAVRPAAGHQRQHLQLAGRQAAGRAVRSLGATARRPPRRRAWRRARRRPRGRRRAPSRHRRSSPSARHADAISTRARAASCGASSRCHPPHARRRDDQRTARVARGEQHHAGGVGGDGVAGTAGAARRRSPASSSAAAWAASMSPAASTISTYGPSRPARVIGSSASCSGAADRGSRPRRSVPGPAGAAPAPAAGSRPVLAGLAVGVFRRRELAAQTMQLAAQVRRGAEDAAGRPGRRCGRGRAPISSRASVPAAPQLQDLGPVHEALAAVEHELGLRVAPPAEGGGPLPGAAHVEQLVATLDHRAVGVAGGDGRHLVGLDRHHGLVQQRHARPPTSPA